MHDVFPELKDFRWQRGYAAFTVSYSMVGAVQAYIANQQHHHKRVSFREEFIEFLRANHISFDERFL
jgi:putative transposase